MSPFFTTPAARAYEARNGVRLVGVPESIAEPRRAGMVYWSSFMGEGLVEVLSIELHESGSLKLIQERTVGEDYIRVHYTDWKHKYCALVEKVGA